MSQENVEVVRRGYEAFSRGDLSTAMEPMAPDVEWAGVLVRLLGVNPVRGKDALLRFFTRDLPQGFTDFEARPSSLEDLGDAVLVETHYSGRGRASGASVSLTCFSLIAFDGGRVVSFRDYDTKEEALEAVGLSE